jgi:hypothetical protein
MVAARFVMVAFAGVGAFCDWSRSNLQSFRSALGGLRPRRFLQQRMQIAPIPATCVAGEEFGGILRRAQDDSLNWLRLIVVGLGWLVYVAFVSESRRWAWVIQVRYCSRVKGGVPAR